MFCLCIWLIGVEKLQKLLKNYCTVYLKNCRVWSGNFVSACKLLHARNVTGLSYTKYGVIYRPKFWHTVLVRFLAEVTLFKEKEWYITCLCLPSLRALRYILSKRNTYILIYVYYCHLYILSFFCLFLARQPPIGPGLPHSRGFQITHNDAPQSVRFL